ncbi:MAG: hypothetical protein JWQ93_2225 [Marmoricola sp.]|jgi:hypothetical protein|nr:hypothetical protein [Marmoricola sp.]
MARRQLIWHLGLAHAPRPVIGANLEAHREHLAQAGVQVVATADEAHLATHELLRTHLQEGLSRPEVEGRWARICDRVWQHKGVSLVSTPDLCAADKDQIRLALDPLIGVEVHPVLTVDSFAGQLYGGWLAELRSGRTTGWEKYADRVLAPTPGHRQGEQFWAGHDLPAMLSRWGWTFHAERSHVLAFPDIGEQWRQLLDIAGVPGEDLVPVVPAYPDPAGVAVLRRVNRQLEQPLGPSTVALLTAGDPGAAVMPAIDTGSLAPRVERWTETLTSAGHDLRGELATLVGEGEGAPMPGPKDQLGIAVDALADALAENSRLRTVVDALESDRERLDRKRRKLRRKLERQRSTAPTR